MPSTLADRVRMQDRLFAELSAMFGREVPLYDRSLAVNRVCNQTVCSLVSGLHLGFTISADQLDRSSGERHGAIRIGRPDEYRWVGRLFAQFGMEPHNFYDMTSVGARSQPVIATAFRSIVRPEHRVFTSLLMTDWFDASTRSRIEQALSERQVFPDRARYLIEKGERQGGLAWEFDHYRFSGTSLGLGSSLSTNTLSVVPRFTVLLDQHWAINAAPLLQLSGENDAKAGDTITGGAIAGFRYAFDQDHVLGAGVLVKGLLGSGVLVVPVPLVDWEITEGLRLSNIRAPEANPFVGLELEQELGREFDLGLGVAWMFRQARLDDSGPNANQIFQEMNLAVYARTEWKPTSNFRLDLVVGTAAYSRLKTLTGGGDTITSTGANASLMVGAFASYRF